LWGLNHIGQKTVGLQLFSCHLSVRRAFSLFISQTTECMIVLSTQSSKDAEVVNSWDEEIRDASTLTSGFEGVGVCEWFRVETDAWLSRWYWSSVDIAGSFHQHLLIPKRKRIEENEDVKNGIESSDDQSSIEASSISTYDGFEMWICGFEILWAVLKSKLSKFSHYNFFQQRHLTTTSTRISSNSSISSTSSTTWALFSFQQFDNLISMSGEWDRDGGMPPFTPFWKAELTDP